MLARVLELWDEVPSAAHLIGTDHRDPALPAFQPLEPPHQAGLSGRQQPVGVPGPKDPSVRDVGP